MAASLAVVAGSEDVWGKHRVKMVDITGDASYPTGGYAITGAQVGLRNIIGVHFVGGLSAGNGVMPFWDNVNGKMMLVYPSGGGAASPAALGAPAIAAGATAMTSAAANGSTDLVPGQGKELLNTTDVHTLTYRALIYSIDS